MDAINRTQKQVKSSRKFHLPMRFSQIPRRGKCMTGMDSRVCKRGCTNMEASVQMTSYPTSSVVAFLVAWGVEVHAGEPVRGEKILYILWSKWLVHKLVEGLLTLFVFRVTLEDLYNGKTSKLQLSKNVLCASCNGYVLMRLKLELNN